MTSRNSMHTTDRVVLTKDENERVKLALAYLRHAVPDEFEFIEEIWEYDSNVCHFILYKSLDDKLDRCRIVGWDAYHNRHDPEYMAVNAIMLSQTISDIATSIGLGCTSYMTAWSALRSIRNDIQRKKREMGKAGESDVTFLLALNDVQAGMLVIARALANFGVSAPD